jgi:NADPH2:quinone reductase
MPKAIRFHQAGGPEVLRLEDLQVGAPGAGEVRIRHTAIGVNFVDTYHRSGLYPLPLPSGLGVEGAGVVEEVGAGVSLVRPGDRVAYTGPLGSYCEVRLVPADRRRCCAERTRCARARRCCGTPRRAGSGSSRSSG